MPTSRSEDPCNLVLLAMQHFTLTRPPFVIRKSTSLVNAGDSLALAPNCFRIEDCHWETVQSGCKMSSSNPFLLLLSVVSSKPGKEICKCFSAFSDAKKDMSKFTKKWNNQVGSRHVGLPSSMSLVLTDAVDQPPCQPKQMWINQSIPSESNQGRLQHSIQPLVYLWFAEWTSWWLCDMHNLTWWFIRYLFTILKINYQFVRKISGHWKCWPLWCHPSSCCLAIIVKQNFYMLDMPWSFKPRRIMYRMKQPLVWGGRTHIRIIESRYPQIHPGQKHPK